MKKIFATMFLALLASVAEAAWLDPVTGMWMSNTCVAPGGAYMTFVNTYGPVGGACTFQFYGSPFVHYGVWR